MTEDIMIRLINLELELKHLKQTLRIKDELMSELTGKVESMWINRHIYSEYGDMQCLREQSPLIKENVLVSACPEADALFELMKPRKTLKPNELPWLSKMGFEVEVTGDTKELSHEFREKNFDHTKENGVLTY